MSQIESALDQLGDRRVINPKGRAKPDRLSIGMSDFIAMNIQPRRKLLAPWLRAGGLAMVHAWRGVGKTHFTMGAALAVATGKNFLRWQAERPCRVLYVDGEMPGKDMQDWAKTALTASDLPIPSADMFRLITPDLIPGGLNVPNLYTAEGQAAIEPDIDGCELVVFDNLATLFRTEGDQNAAGTWVAAQDYLLSLRRRGIAVLLVDHDNKSGGNRGTSAKEDVLETVIHLKKPTDYVSSQGARFEIHFSKHRGFHGKDAASFEAQLFEDRGNPIWVMRNAEDVELGRIDEMIASGMKDREIRAELGMGGSKLLRLKESLKNRGS